MSVCNQVSLFYAFKTGLNQFKSVLSGLSLFKIVFTYVVVELESKVFKNLGLNQISFNPNLHCDYFVEITFVLILRISC